MFTFNRLVLTVMLVGVAVVAWGAVKIPSFAIEESFVSTCDGTVHPINLDAEADGMAILHYAPGKNKTIVQVIVSDFTGDPGMLGRYFVRLSPGDDLNIGTFLVDS